MARGFGGSRSWPVSKAEKAWAEGMAEGSCLPRGCQKEEREVGASLPVSRPCPRCSALVKKSCLLSTSARNSLMESAL